MLDQVRHGLEAPRLALAQAFAELFLARSGVRHVREDDRADDGFLVEAPGAEDGEDQALVLEDDEFVQTERRELLVQEAEACRGRLFSAEAVADAGHLALVCELALRLFVHPA